MREKGRFCFEDQVFAQLKCRRRDADEDNLLQLSENVETSLFSGDFLSQLLFSLHFVPLLSESIFPHSESRHFENCVDIFLTLADDPIRGRLVI